MDRDSKSVPVLVENTQQKSKDTPRPAAIAGCLQTFVVGWDIRELSEVGLLNKSGPNRPRFGCAKGGLCSGLVCSPCPRTTRLSLSWILSRPSAEHEPVRVGLLRVGRVGLVDLPRWGWCWSGSRAK